MSKYTLRSLRLAAGAVLTIFLFQNCGVNPQFDDEVLNQLSSQSPNGNNIQQTHVDLEVEDQTPQKKGEIETDFELIMSDRFFTKSILERVFGPSTRAADSQNFESNPLEFGSICSVYEQYRSKNAAGAYVNNSADAMYNCSISSSTGALGAVWNPKPTVVRAAMMSKTCSELVMNATTFAYALKQVSADAIPAPTSANMTKLFMLFYQGKPAPHQALIDSLLVMMDPDAMTKDSWKAPMFTICASPHWQVM